MKHNLPLHKNWQLRIKPNFSKCLFILYFEIHKQMNQIEKIDLWQTLHANRNIKISSTETSVVKELVLVIPQLWH